MRVGFVASVTK